MLAKLIVVHHVIADRERAIPADRTQQTLICSSCFLSQDRGTNTIERRAANDA